MKYFLLILFALFFGCEPKEKSSKKYLVISSFNEVVKETDDKTEAYEAAHSLTLMGRVFSSKPCYFVVENK